MPDTLFDRDINFYRYGCCDEDGEFDAEKAAELGFSEAQFPAIKEALAAAAPPPQPTEESIAEE